MRNIMLKLCYDGTHYAGWQRQDNAITVQGVIEDSLFKLFGERLTVTGCGRTDSGVHAKGYVCNFYTDSKLENHKIINALNNFVPNDIVFFDCKDVMQDFNSRFCVKSKEYVYTIDNSKFGNVFIRNYSWHYKYDIVIESMIYASRFFIGTHDFKGFMSTGSTPKTTVRTIYDINITKTENTIKISVSGNGFLYNMVRIIVGTLVYVGNGRIDKENVGNIIEFCDRNRAGITAPASGLCLNEVIY